MRHTRIGAVACCVVASVWASAAWGQTLAASPTQVDTARQRAPAPLPTLREFDLRLQAPEKSPVQRAIDEIDFEVKSVRVLGASAYPVTELEAMFEGLKNRRVSLADLREIAERIEDRYRADDYFLTRVFIPPQRVKDGVFEVRVIEGRIGAVFIEGGSEAQRARLEAALASLSQEKPIRLKTLERAVLLVDEMPGVGAAGLLRAGAASGESDLVLTLSPLSDSQMLGANNASSNTAGQWNLSGYATLNNPFGVEGQLSAGLSASPDMKQSQTLFTRFARALRPGTTASLGAVVSRSQPGGSLAVLESKSTSISINPRLRQTLLRSREHALYMDVALAMNHATTRYFDVLTTEDRSSVAEVSWAWQGLDPQGATQASLSHFRGTGLAGALGADAPLPSVSGFEPRFKKWVYSFTRTHRLPASTSVLLNMQTQHSRDVLMSGEVAAFGGSQIGRGYDSAAITGDRGTGALLELRHDTSIEWNGKTLQLQPYVFVDTALTVSNQNHTTQRLRSCGTGLRLSSSAVALDLMLARAEIPIATTDPKTNPRLVFNSVLRF